MFTLENTAGFSASELEILNTVLATLTSGSDPDDVDGAQAWEKSVSDAINDCWLSGMSARELEQSVRRRTAGY